MPNAKGKRRPLERTQKAKKVRPGAPLLETRARAILSTMVSEVAEASTGPTDLQLPEAPPPVVESVPPAEASTAEAEQSLDDLSTSALAEIARQGASLELDGNKHDAAALVSLAKNVKDDAHLKITNSGTFSAEELALIARSTPGQVIFA